jgi:hypothetical protein
MAGLGGAGHANPLLNDSVYQNPSFASFLPVYSWSGNFQALGEGRGRAYNLSVLDGRSELFQASAAYAVRDDFTALHLGASKKILPLMTVGVGAKLIYSKNKTVLENSKNASLSATLAPFDWFQISATADNLVTNSNTSQLGLHRELVLGTKFKATEKLLFYIDPHFRLGAIDSLRMSSATGYEIGSEIGLFKDFYLRLGRFKNVTRTEARANADGFGYGFGWIAPRVSLDYGTERILTPTDQLTHNFGVTFYF